MYIDHMNFICGLPKAKFGLMSQKVAKIDNIAENMKYHKFLRLYAKFCLGKTTIEVHISNLHVKVKLLMYDKGAYSTKNFPSPEGGLRIIRKIEQEENKSKGL